MNLRSFITLSALLTFSTPCVGEDRSKIVRDPDPAPLSPEKSRERIQIMEPFRIDLIAAEPMVREPICMAWGGDGALYVVELRGFMQDVDNTGSQDPVGQVVRLVDTDGDGVMDTRTVFVDKLVEPRAVAPIQGGILIGAPPDLFFCKDTTGDGVADIRTSIFSHFGSRSGNVEHKINGLMWGLDNFFYNAKSDKKFRYIPDENGGMIIEVRSGHRGQWGITQDNIGNLYGTGNTVPWIGEQIAYDYLLHNDLVHDPTFADRARLEDDFDKVWPIVGTPDVQSGPGILREDGTLSSFTAIGGQHIFRGDKLGDEMIGQYFIPEPVGHLVRRSIIIEEDGFRKLTNPDKEKHLEFIASTDMNFRPVYVCTGPDGCLYMVDMYRGIIQDGNWTQEGSYLREEILRKSLDMNVQRGRIYRVSKKGVAPGPVPKLDTFSNEQLVAALAHPNGWWRDEAQKRLVLAQDTSVIALLKNMVTEEAFPLGRVHAVWTLRGLDAWDQSLATTAMRDTDWRVRLAAIRASETLMQNNVEFIESLADVDLSNMKIVKQLILSLGLCNTTADVSPENRKAAGDLIAAIAMAWPTNELIILSTIVSMPGQEEQLLASVLDREWQAAGAMNWLRILGRRIIRSFDNERAEDLLRSAAAADDTSRKYLIEGIAEALPRSGRGRGSRVTLIRFEKKPEALTALEEASKEDETTAEAMEKTLLWFTWPGEPRYEKAHAQVAMAPHEVDLFNRGQTIYKGLCLSCHAGDGMGVTAPIRLGPALAGNKRVEGEPDPLIKIMLHGLTGPIDGETYSGLMAPMGANDDEWIASVLTYIRRAWGNIGESIPGHEVKRVREETKDRKTPWTEKELK